MSVVYRHKVNPGDWVVMATDGLWDNMSYEEVALFLKKNVHIGLENITKKLG
jgi:serine/threonine protein phosphatase PrpC